MQNNDDMKRIMQKIQLMENPPSFSDCEALRTQSQIMAHSAEEVSRVQHQMDEICKEAAVRSEMRDMAIHRTAEESVAHTRLLEKQLQEVQAQNELLRNEAATNKAEAEASRKATKKANRLSIWAMVLSTILGAGSIVASVLIALYL